MLIEWRQLCKRTTSPNTLSLENLPQLLVLQAEKLFKKEKCGQQLAAPHQLNIAYSISGSGVEMEKKVFKMVAKLKYKRTSITTMRNKFRFI
jgi:hypothetical protein